MTKFCSWPLIENNNWSSAMLDTDPKATPHTDSISLNPETLTLLAVLLSFGAKLVLVYLLGCYDSWRRYYEPQASEVRAYSAEIGCGSSRRSGLKQVVFSDQVADYVASIALATMDPLSLSYSSDYTMHDYGRPLTSCLLILGLSRGAYYSLAYNLYSYFSRENFATPLDFLQRRFNSASFTNFCALLILLSEILYLLMQFNSVTHNLASLGSSFYFWLLILTVTTFIFTQFGTKNLLRMGMLMYGSSLAVYFWLAMELRSKFNSVESAAKTLPKTDDPYDGVSLTVDETKAEHGGNLVEILLYESSLACMLLAAPVLHCAFRFSQVDYMILQTVQSRHRRRRLFIRAFLLNMALQVSHTFVLRSVLTVERQGGCDPILTGKVCHYSLISSAVSHSVTLRCVYLAHSLYLLCWSAAIRSIAVTFCAIGSWMRGFAEFCLVGQRWVMMDRWRKQSGVNMFRNCELINMDRLLFNTLLIALMVVLYLMSVDLAAWDPSLRWLQVVHYLLLDMRYLLLLNSCLLGLAFRKFTATHLRWSIGISVVTYTYVLLWCNRIDAESLQYKMMVPLYLHNSAQMRRNCSKTDKLRPVINVGKRLSDHDVLHLIDSDAVYPAALVASWLLAAVVCKFSGKLAVLQSPFYRVGADIGGKSGGASVRSGFRSKLRKVTNSLTTLSSSRTKQLCSLLQSMRTNDQLAAADAAARSAAAAAADPEGGVDAPPAVAQLRRRAEWLSGERYSIQVTDVVLDGLSEAVRQHRQLRRRRNTAEVQL